MTSQEEDGASRLLRASQFSYYFFRSMESKLEAYLGILEGDDSAYGKTSSLPGKAVSGVAGVIPYVGKGVSIAVQEADSFILKKIRKKESKAFFNFTYKYRDDMEAVREVLLTAALKIFINFEAQFMSVDTDGGKTRAMHKLAMDASYRLITYILENNDEQLTPDVIVKGVLKGTSLGGTLGLFKRGKTVRNDEKELKTSKIFTKVGICLIEDNQRTYYKTDDTSTDKYGHRLVFDFEDKEVIKTLWEKEEKLDDYDYELLNMDFDYLSAECKKYLLKQYPLDEAKAERKGLHEEAQKHREELSQDARDDRDIKHEEAKEHREELYIETAQIIKEVSKMSTEEIKNKVEEASKIGEENLGKTLEVIKTLHEETTSTIRSNTDEVKGALVVINKNIRGTKKDISRTDKKVDKKTEQLTKTIEEIKEKIEEDDKAILKINKKQLKNHPDVKNVQTAFRKIGNIGECGEAKKIEREVKRISDDLARAEVKVKKFFKW